jgi:hypothetical protein
MTILPTRCTTKFTTANGRLERPDLIPSVSCMIKKMAALGFEEGIGFVPFAGIGWELSR